MNLLDRYLGALQPLLPRKAAGDILREIEDEIQSQMEERAEALGRTLTEEEGAEIIQKHGHPMIVAARYGETRYLIGPELFPFYWQTLKVSWIVALVIWSVAIAVGLLSSPEPGGAWIPVLLRVPGALLTIFGVITALFTAGQFSRRFVRSKLEGRWDPRSLPVVSRHSPKRAQSVAEIFLGAIGLIWWQSVPAAPFLALGPAASFMKLGPAWGALHWPVLILIAAAIGKSALRLFWPERAFLHARIALLLDAAELVLLVAALRVGDWVVVQRALAGTGSYAAAADALNQILIAGCFISLLVRAIQFVFKCLRRWRESTPKSGLRAVSVL